MSSFNGVIHTILINGMKESIDEKRIQEDTYFFNIFIVLFGGNGNRFNAIGVYYESFWFDKKYVICRHHYTVCIVGIYRWFIFRQNHEKEKIFVGIFNRDNIFFHTFDNVLVCERGYFCGRTKSNYDISFVCRGRDAWRNVVIVMAVFYKNTFPTAAIVIYQCRNVPNKEVSL